MRDSQYVREVTDSQINAAVSGALDRLHYEKDPCVRYDSSRKLWIYLHRARTEEDFGKRNPVQIDHLIYSTYTELLIGLVCSIGF